MRGKESNVRKPASRENQARSFEYQPIVVACTASLSDQGQKGMYDRLGSNRFRQMHRPENIFRTFSLKGFFWEFGLGGDEGIPRMFFHGPRGRGAAGGKDGFIGKDTFAIIQLAFGGMIGLPRIFL